MNKDLKIFSIIILALGVAAMAITYEVLTWAQCIKGNPWWYCLRILG